MKTVPFEPLDPALYREPVRRALAEDFGWGDVTTEATVAAIQRARGVILAKARCVIAGLDVARGGVPAARPRACRVRCRVGRWRSLRAGRRSSPSSGPAPPRC